MLWLQVCSELEEKNVMATALEAAVLFSNKEIFAGNICPNVCAR